MVVLCSSLCLWAADTNPCMTPTLQKPRPYTANRPITETAQLPSLSHIWTMNFSADTTLPTLAGMDKGVVCVSMVLAPLYQQNWAVDEAETEATLPNSLGGYTWGPEQAFLCRSVLVEPGCTETEWEELNSKLKHIMVWKEQHQVMRDALAGGWCPFSVVQAQVMAVSARPSSPSTKSYQGMCTSSSYLGC